MLPPYDIIIAGFQDAPPAFSASPIFILSTDCRMRQNTALLFLRYYIFDARRTDYLFTFISREQEAFKTGRPLTLGTFLTATLYFHDDLALTIFAFF